MFLFFYLVFVNAFIFIVCCVDKVNACNGGVRIRESFLLSISFFGGCFGFLFGMYLFHHKTRKNKFKSIYIIFIVWIYLLFIIPA